MATVFRETPLGRLLPDAIQTLVQVLRQCECEYGRSLSAVAAGAHECCYAKYLANRRANYSGPPHYKVYLNDCAAAFKELAHGAAQAGDLDCLQLLFAEYKEFAVPHYLRVSTAAAAAEAGHYRAMLASFPNYQETVGTIFCAAASGGHLKCMRICYGLTRHGLQIRYALSLASEKGHEDCARYCRGLLIRVKVVPSWSVPFLINDRIASAIEAAESDQIWHWIREKEGPPHYTVGGCIIPWPIC